MRWEDIGDESVSAITISVFSMFQYYQYFHFSSVSSISNLLAVASTSVLLLVMNGVEAERYLVGD